jgi:hypothetical protein
MAVISLRLIDRSNRKPDHEDDDDNTVADRSNFVHPVSTNAAS